MSEWPRALLYTPCPRCPDSYAAGFRAGAEAMRERAAQAIMPCTFGDNVVTIIRALPIEPAEREP